jgi:hypothetical protein
MQKAELAKQDRGIKENNVIWDVIPHHGSKGNKNRA